MSYKADPARYDGRCSTGAPAAGLDLPALSLGYWHNFGDDRPFEAQRAISRRAFDLGITHHDLANNYGPPYGAAEINFGRSDGEDFGPYRDELVISTKAGWDMWPGPYGQGGGSRKYLLASLDQSLARMGLDYVDIFYRHRLDADRRRSRRRWARSTQPCGRARRSTSGSRPTTPSARAQAAAILRRPRHPAADPPAVLLDGQPLDRDRGPARRRRRARDRGDRVHRARPGTAHGSLPRRHAGRLPRRAGQDLRHRLAHRRDDRPAAGAERDRRTAAARPSRSSHSPGRSATSG